MGSRFTNTETSRKFAERDVVRKLRNSTLLVRHRERCDSIGLLSEDRDPYHIGEEPLIGIGLQVLLTLFLLSALGLQVEH